MRKIKTAYLTLFILGLAACSAGAAKRKVIIDQDSIGPGGANLQPILMLLQDPEVEVLGITVESGDGWQKESVAHTLRMLEIIDRTDVPVLVGSTYPLVNTQERTKRWEQLYGKIQYKGAWMESLHASDDMNHLNYHEPDVIPPMPEGEPTTKPLDETAANFLARMTRTYPGEVSIIALGPATNLALAARLDDDFGKNAKELVFMGGSFNPHFEKQTTFTQQITYTPRHSFNVRWDPEAVYVTLRAGWPRILVIPTDVTFSTSLTPELLARATTADTALTRYVKEYAEVGFPLWDEIAVAAWRDESVITESKTYAMDIDIMAGPHYGANLTWPAGEGPGIGEPDVIVVTKIDGPKVDNMFVELINRK